MPSTYLSRRARILESLVRQLKTISTANGYAVSPRDVKTDVRGWAETPEAETPIIYVIDEDTVYNYRAGKTTEREWTISLYGVMKNSSQYVMEELISDIETCLFKNVTLSFDGQIPGPVSHMRITNIITDSQMFSQIEGSYLFKISLQILYVACVDNVR